MNYAKTYMFCLAASLAAMTACTEKNEYIPAEPVVADCPGVYFDAGNSKNFMFIPGGDATMAVDMHRLNSSAEIDVPLDITVSNEGIKCPTSVHFAAGESDAQLVIDCSELPAKQLASVEIRIPERFINPYKANYFDYKASVLLSGWEPANVDGSPVKFWFTEYNYNSYTYVPKVKKSVFEPIESEMEVLPGAGLIRIHDFMGTGVTTTLRLTPSPYADFEGFYRIYPDDCFETYVEAYESDSYGDSWYNAWFMYNEEADDYPDATYTTLDGRECVSDYPTFYSYSDSYAYECSYANLKSADRNFNSGLMQFSGTFSIDLELPDFLYVFFTWDGESGI